MITLLCEDDLISFAASREFFFLRIVLIALESNWEVHVIDCNYQRESVMIRNVTYLRVSNRELRLR